MNENLWINHIRLRLPYRLSDFGFELSPKTGITFPTHTTIFKSQPNTSISFKSITNRLKNHEYNSRSCNSANGVDELIGAHSGARPGAGGPRAAADRRRERHPQTRDTVPASPLATAPHAASSSATAPPAPAPTLCELSVPSSGSLFVFDRWCLLVCLLFLCSVLSNGDVIGWSCVNGCLGIARVWCAMVDVGRIAFGSSVVFYDGLV